MKRTYRGIVLNAEDKVDVRGYGKAVVVKVREGGKTVDVKLDSTGETIRRHASLCSYRKEE